MCCSPKFVIPVNDKTRDLITYLHRGIAPSDHDKYFMFTISRSGQISNRHTDRFEKPLYRDPRCKDQTVTFLDITEVKEVSPE